MSFDKAKKESLKKRVTINISNSLFKKKNYIILNRRHLSQKVVNSIHITENSNGRLTLSATIGGKVIEIQQNENQEVNITQASKLFNKRWVNWKNKNLKLIQTLELLENKKLVREIGPVNKQQTFISITLALYVFNSYDPVFFYRVITFYKNSSAKNQLDILIKLIFTKKS